MIMIIMLMIIINGLLGLQSWTDNTNNNYINDNARKYKITLTLYI